MACAKGGADLFSQATISELEKMLREREASVHQRERLSEMEIARREDTIRERETRIT
jgi:hypothetical protein